MQRIKLDQNNTTPDQLAAAIAQLQRTTDFILKQLNVQYVDDPASYLPPELAGKMAALIQQGKKGELDAIKLCRAQAGAGFAEATAVVEDMKKGMTPR